MLKPSNTNSVFFDNAKVMVVLLNRYPLHIIIYQK